MVQTIMKKSRKENMEVICLRGDQEESGGDHLVLTLGVASLEDRHIHCAADGKRYLVLHGGGLAKPLLVPSIQARVAEACSRRWRSFMRVVGGWFLPFHRRSEPNGQPDPRSLAVNPVRSPFDAQVLEWADLHQCDGVICGHLHAPEDRMIGKVRYMNSGDWVTHQTAVIEHEDGSLELIDYPNFTRQIRAARLSALADTDASRSGAEIQSTTGSVAAFAY